MVSQLCGEGRERVARRGAPAPGGVTVCRDTNAGRLAAGYRVARERAAPGAPCSLQTRCDTGAAPLRSLLGGARAPGRAGALALRRPWLCDAWPA